MYKKLVISFLSAFILCASGFSFAEPLVSRNPALNLAPLGVEIGYANVGGVKQKVGELTSLRSAGINAYTHGVMLSSSGDGLGIDGLSSITFIFDDKDILQGVLMTLPKKVNEMNASLAKKYKLVSNKIDSFMGYGSAKYVKGDSTVEISADHLSFEMNVNYLSNSLWTSFKRESQTANEAKKKNQESKF